MSKSAAALSAFKKCILDCSCANPIETIGIGSGSTIISFVEALGKYAAESNRNFKCIPTSYQAQELIIKNRLTLATLDEHPELDLSFDGADEIIENSLDAIKGGGGCLLREKVVNFAAKKFVILCDDTKVSQFFGQNWKRGLPIEILPLALNVVKKAIETRLGGQLVVRGCMSKLGPAISDNGHFLADWIFDPDRKDLTWHEIDAILHSIPGVIETGLFLGMATEIHVGFQDGSSRVITK